MIVACLRLGHTDSIYSEARLKLPALIAVLAWFVAPAFAAPRVIAVDVDGAVHPITAEIIAQAIDQARAEHATCLLIRLSTPGGLLDATREAIEHIVASPVPVITYVTPSGARAASAGFFLPRGRRHCRHGARHEYRRGLAGPPRAADGPGDAQQDRERCGGATCATSPAGAVAIPSWRRRPFARRKSFTDKEALDNHLIEIVAANEHDLLNQVNGRQVTRFNGSRQTLNTAGAEIAAVQLTWRERLVSIIADPNIGFVLLIVGAFGLYIEFSTPGLVFPGVFGAVLVMLGLSSLAVLPINWVGVGCSCWRSRFSSWRRSTPRTAFSASAGRLHGSGRAAADKRTAVGIAHSLSTALAVSMPFALITSFLLTIVVQARRNKVVTGVAGMLGRNWRRQTRPDATRDRCSCTASIGEAVARRLSPPARACM